MKEYSIATFGTHSALQILKGAKDEGFRTVCICLPGKEQPYRSFRVADEIITIDSFMDFFRIEDELIRKNCIMVPHASMIAYMGAENISRIRAMFYGERKLLEVEESRERQKKWLADSGLTMPKCFSRAEDIDRLCMVKFDGAKGGAGYFLAKDLPDFSKKIGGRTGYAIQEYIVGAPVYIHYFYSAVNGELELMGFDKRYESNADGIGRINAGEQISAGIQASYSITGNIPIVIRESLLPEVFRMGESVVAQSRKLAKKGLFGPFCLETVVTPDLRFYVFEISARIVAGTNAYTGGSPYTQLRYNEPMSTGRRIAREIKEAINTGRLDMILG